MFQGPFRDLNLEKVPKRDRLPKQGPEWELCKWTPSTSDDDFSGSKHAIDPNPSQDDALGCPASDDVPYVYGCLNKFSFDLSWHYLNFWSAK